MNARHVWLSPSGQRTINSSGRLRELMQITGGSQGTMVTPTGSTLSFVLSQVERNEIVGRPLTTVLGYAGNVQQMAIAVGDGDHPFVVLCAALGHSRYPRNRRDR